MHPDMHLHMVVDHGETRHPCTDSGKRRVSISIGSTGSVTVSVNMTWPGNAVHSSSAAI